MHTYKFNSLYFQIHFMLNFIFFLNFFSLDEVNKVEIGLVIFIINWFIYLLIYLYLVFDSSIHIYTQLPLIFKYFTKIFFFRISKSFCAFILCCVKFTYVECCIMYI